MTNNITKDGNFENPVAVKAARTSYPIANFQELRFYHQEFAQNAAAYVPGQLGITHSIHDDGVLVEEKNFKNIGGGLVTFTRTFCKVPSIGFTRPTLATFSFPGRIEQWPKYEFTEQFDRGWRIKEFEDKILQPKRVKTVEAKEFITFHNLAVSKTEETEISPGIIISSTTFADGYNFDDIAIVEAFKIIESGWFKVEEIEPGDNPDYIRTQNRPLPSFETDFLSTTSSPSIDNYNEKISTEEYIQIQNTKIEQLIGPIYQSIDLKVKAQ